MRYEPVVEKHVNQLEGWHHHQDEEIQKLRNEVRHLEEEMNFVLPIAGWLLGVLLVYVVYNLIMYVRIRRRG